ncbi:hypothetical protein [Streptomyces virginiae]|uniref:HTH cro/C1-type domain-containing protein n=1 Tax=Streptomyces virginiae TaxID=1961 RepID=A0ABZ1TR18_STRVG|nr:hypothetical protein [Streptomyces virginiae]
MGAPEGKVAYVYAAALRKALDGYLAGGGTQKDLARAIGTSPTSVTRHLKGRRITPRKQLRAIKAYLQAQGVPCPDEVWAELEELCDQAHLASKSPAVQRDHLAEELARVCAEYQRARWIAEKQLHGLEQRSDRLAEDLRQALTRAQQAERTRRILQERVTVQDRSLRKAGDYAHTIEDELAREKKQTGLLRKETDVLREQNRRLIEERPAVAAPATQLDHAHTRYIYIPVPGLAVETAPTTAEASSAASSPQWQVPPPEPPDNGPGELYRTTPLREEDQYGYEAYGSGYEAYSSGYEAYGSGYCSPDQHSYDTLLANNGAGTWAAPYGYQEDAITRPHPQTDPYGNDPWVASPYDPVTYDAWGYQEDAAGPPPGEPSLHTPAAPPTPLPHQEDENAQQLARTARPNHTTPPRIKAGALPTLALLAVVVGSRVL